MVCLCRLSLTFMICLCLHSLTLPLSTPSHTHTHTHTHCLTHIHSLPMSSLSRSPSLFMYRTHTHTHTPSLSLTDIVCLNNLSLSFFLSYLTKKTHTHSLTHIHGLYVLSLSLPSWIFLLCWFVFIFSQFRANNSRSQCLILPSIEQHVFNIVSDYRGRHWTDKILFLLQLKSVFSKIQFF